MASDMTQLETLFLALGDRTRLRLLSLMAPGPVPVGLLVDLTGESQPKVSRHLAYLRNCGVVAAQRKGRQIYYGINSSGDTAACQMLAVVVAQLTGKTAARKTAVREAVANRPQKSASATEIYEEANIAVPESDHAWGELEEDLPDRPAEREEQSEMDVFLL
ncbi:MAG: winged helix-turn-helix transcriptional regulator [Chloracidobacterium sp.]|nr:winged helix-turn-helix transcriptional regulator [Chloracidobacterium sp.]